MVAATLWVSVAVLLVGIGALVVSVIAMRDTHSMRAELSADMKRRTEEMRPRLSGKIYDCASEGNPVKFLLILWVTSPWPIEKLVVTLRPDMGYAFVTANGEQTLIGTLIDSKSRQPCTLTSGGSIGAPIAKIKNTWTGPATVYVNCHGRLGEEWRDVPVTINIGIDWSSPWSSLDIPWPTNVVAVQAQHGVFEDVP